VNAAPGRPLVLVIIDGWGYRTDPFGNAIAAAKKPNWDALWQRWPHTILAAAGGYQLYLQVAVISVGAQAVWLIQHLWFYYRDHPRVRFEN